MEYVLWKKSSYMEENNTLTEQDGTQVLEGQLDFNSSEILSDSSSESDLKLEKNEKHSRTPSGQVLTDFVEDVRNIFTNLNSTPKRKREEKVCEKAPVDRDNEDSLAIPKLTRVAEPCNLVNNVTLKCENNKLKNKARKLAQKSNQESNRGANRNNNTAIGAGATPKHKQRRISVNEIPDPTEEQLREISHMLHEKQHQRDSFQNAGINRNTKADTMTKPSDTATEAHDKMDVEQNDHDNPQILSLKMVQQMFTDIKVEMKEMKSSIEKLEKKGKEDMKSITDVCVKEVIQKVNTDDDATSKTTQKLKEDIRHLKYQNKTLTNVLERTTIELDEVKTRLENLEIAGAKKAITINGLYIDNKKEDGLWQLQEFFEKNLELTMYVEDFYKMGANEPKTIIVYLQSVFDKRQIMKYKHYLKDVRNRDNKKIYINDYTSTNTQEKRKRESQMKKLNEARDKPLDFKYVKGKLTIQGETYTPKVSVPTPRDLVDLSPETLDSILKMSLESTTPIIREKSIFEGYIASVNSFQQIRQLYTKMKLIQPAARHIVCAYFLPGDNFYHNQGYCDDGEPSAGNVILQTMIRNKLSNRVIFVSRKYGGVRMGMDRFECYHTAAVKVAQEHNYNAITKEKQMLSAVEHVKPYQDLKVPKQGKSEDTHQRKNQEVNYQNQK